MTGAQHHRLGAIVAATMLSALLIGVVAVALLFADAVRRPAYPQSIFTRLAIAGDARAVVPVRRHAHTKIRRSGRTATLPRRAHRGRPAARVQKGEARLNGQRSPAVASPQQPGLAPRAAGTHPLTPRQGAARLEPNVVRTVAVPGSYWRR